MKVIAAYCSVVLIWATTPLAIKWSNSSLSFIEAVTARMCIALVCALLIAAMLNKRIFESINDWKPMTIGAFAFFPIMLVVYWSAQYISSGLISVIFGSTPFFVGILSILILQENSFNMSRVVALIMGVIGLAIIHVDQLSMDASAALGVLGILISTLLFALSTVLLKKVGGGVDPVRQLAGSLVIAAPCFFVTWLLFDGELPSNIDRRSASGVIYLVIAGSIVGGLAFYYVLRKCAVTTVSLIPLLTPVLALFVGHVMEDERMNGAMLVGVVFVLGSLALYQGVFQHVNAVLCKMKKYSVNKIQNALLANLN